MIAQQHPVPSRPRRRVLCALLAVVLLAACQSRAPEVGVAEPSWRVVERSGEASFRPPGRGSWIPVMGGEALPAGSRIATGAGGRLIVARGADMVVMGTAGALVLPDGLGRAALHQQAGELRYRMAGGSAPPLRITTAQLAVEGAGAVFDLEAGADRSRVRVLEGRLRVVSADGARAVALDPGDEAVAPAAAPWRVRRNGEAYATLAPAATEPPSQPGVPAPPDRTVVPAAFLQPPQAPPAAAAAEAVEAPAPRPIPPSPPAAKPFPGPPPADPRASGFAGLTAGLLDALPAQRLEAPRRHP